MQYSSIRKLPCEVAGNIDLSLRLRLSAEVLVTHAILTTVLWLSIIYISFGDVLFHNRRHGS